MEKSSGLIFGLLREAFEVWVEVIAAGFGVETSSLVFVLVEVIAAGNLGCLE